MRLTFRLLAALPILLIGTATQAQTAATIGTFNGGTFGTSTYTGSGAFINTNAPGNAPVDQWVTGSSNTGGQTGNAIIVTPVSDPVIYFNAIKITNATSNPLLSLTLRLPQFGLGDPRRTQLGFFDLPTTALKTAGGSLFSVSFFDPIGAYDGDYVPYHGKTLYSTIHFYQGTGSAKLDPFGQGYLSYTAAYPNEPSLTFKMDNSPGTGGTSAPNTTLFNTPSNPGGGIRAVTPEAPGVLQLLPGLLPVAYVLKRRRTTKKS